MLRPVGKLPWTCILLTEVSPSYSDVLIALPVSSICIWFKTWPVASSSTEELNFFFWHLMGLLGWNLSLFNSTFNLEYKLFVTWLFVISKAGKRHVFSLNSQGISREVIFSNIPKRQTYPKKVLRSNRCFWTLCLVYNIQKLNKRLSLLFVLPINVFTTVM
jgi:hypothetical protein